MPDPAENSGPTPTNSEGSAGNAARTPPHIFSANLNLSAIVLTALIVFSLVKLSAFLPQSYYFTLTSLVGGDRASPFIISTPVLLTNDEICERAAAKNIEIEQLCSTEEDEEDENEAAKLNKNNVATMPPAPGEQKPAPSGDQRRTDDAGSGSPPAPATAPATSEKKAESDEAEKRRMEEKQIEAGLRIMRQQQRESAAVRAIQTEAPQGKSILALVLRCLIPLLAGGIVATLYRADMPAEIGIGAAFAVAALFWPVAYLWQTLPIDEEWNDKQNLFMMLYIAYAALFYFLAKVGSQLGYAYFGMRHGIPSPLDKKRMLESFIPGLIAGILVQLFVALLLK